MVANSIDVNRRLDIIGFIREKLGVSSKPEIKEGYGMKYNIITNAIRLGVIQSHLIFILDNYCSNRPDIFINAMLQNNASVNVYSFKDICVEMLKVPDAYSYMKELIYTMNMESDLIDCMIYVMVKENKINEQLLELLINIIVYRENNSSKDEDDKTVRNKASLRASAISRKKEYEVVTQSKMHELSIALSRIENQMSKEHKDLILRPKRFIKESRIITYKLMESKLDKHKISEMHLDTEFVSFWSCKDGFKEQYHIYCKDDYPSDEIEIVVKPGTHIGISVPLNIYEHKLVQKPIDLYLDNVMRQRTKQNIITVSLGEDTITYRHNLRLAIEPHELIKKILDRFEVRDRGIMLESKTVYLVDTGITMDATILLDMMWTNTNYTDSVMYRTAILDENKMTMAYKKFVRFNVFFAGVNFRIKIVKGKESKSKKDVERKSSSFTKLLITDISNSLDEGVMMRYCNMLVSMYKSHRDHHKNIYYTIFDDPFVGYHNESMNDPLKPRSIGSSRYCKNSGTGVPYELNLEEDDIEEYKAKGYDIQERKDSEGKVHTYACTPGTMATFAANTKLRDNLTNKLTIKGSKSGRSNKKSSNKMLINTGAILSHCQSAKVTGFDPLLGTTNIYRRGVERTPSSFLHCILIALNLTVDPKAFRKMTDLNFWVVKQEMKNHTIDDIEKEFRDVNVTLDSSKYIRLFETYFKCNILVFLMKKKGEILLETKTYYNDYIWYPEHPTDYIVIAKNDSIVEGARHDPPYELLVHHPPGKAASYIFRGRHLHNLKMEISDFRVLKDPVNQQNYDYQYISEQGLCVFVGVRRDDKILWESCYDRPLNMEHRFINDDELYSLEETMKMRKLKSSKIEVDCMYKNGQKFIIGIWHGNKYYPTSISAYIDKYSIGERNTSIDRGYSEMAACYRNYKNKCLYTSFISSTFLNSKLSAEDFIKDYTVITDKEISLEKELSLKPYDDMVESYPELFEDRKIKWLESERYRLESVLKISAKLPLAFAEYNDLDSHQRHNKISFYRYEDYRAWRPVMTFKRSYRLNHKVTGME